jgi:hypothetical protein
MAAAGGRATGGKQPRLHGVPHAGKGMKRTCGGKRVAPTRAKADCSPWSSDEEGPDSEDGPYQGDGDAWRDGCNPGGAAVRAGAPARKRPRLHYYAADQHARASSQSRHSVDGADEWDSSAVDAADGDELEESSEGALAPIDPCEIERHVQSQMRTLSYLCENLDVIALAESVDERLTACHDDLSHYESDFDIRCGEQQVECRSGQHGQRSLSEYFRRTQGDQGAQHAPRPAASVEAEFANAAAEQRQREKLARMGVLEAQAAQAAQSVRDLFAGIGGGEAAQAFDDGVRQHALVEPRDVATMRIQMAEHCRKLQAMCGVLKRLVGHFSSDVSQAPLRLNFVGKQLQRFRLLELKDALKAQQAAMPRERQPQAVEQLLDTLKAKRAVICAALGQHE